MKRFAFFLACATLAGLFYVYEEVEAVKVGYTIRKQEEAKVLALDRARALKYNIAHLKAPHNLERKLVAQRIELEAPKTWKTLVLANPSIQRTGLAQQQRMPFLTKFFIGTAQAEAKESSR